MSQTLSAICTVAELNQNRVIASQVIRPEVRGFQEPNETSAPGKRTLVALGVGSGRIHQSCLVAVLARGTNSWPVTEERRARRPGRPDTGLQSSQR